MKDTSQVINNVAATRKQRGLSASKLAQQVGVSRQTIYALEAGTYVPNTLVSLRLASVLEVSVDDLFSLVTNQPVAPRPAEPVTLLPSPDAFQIGEHVRLCHIDGKLLASKAMSALPFLPETDGTFIGKSRVALHDGPANLNNRLLLAGCDPAMSLLEGHLQPLGLQLVLLHANSSESLSLLQQGHVHIAGTHLRDAKSGESNVPLVTRKFKDGAVAVISFAIAGEGFVTAAGNPKSIKSIQDLGRKDINIVNREAGSGSRHLLETQMRIAKLEPADIRGFQNLASGHLAAASEVKNGLADCCLATCAVGRMLGLHFIPVQSVRYDLVIRQQHLKLPAVQTLMNAISSLKFRQKLKSVGGYDVAVSGDRII